MFTNTGGRADYVLSYEGEPRAIALLPASDLLCDPGSSDTLSGPQAETQLLFPRIPSEACGETQTFPSPLRAAL